VTLMCLQSRQSLAVADIEMQPDLRPELWFMGLGTEIQH